MDEGALLSYFSSPKFTLPPAIRGNLNIIRMPYIKSTIYPFHVATMSAPAGSRQNKQPRGACTERLSMLQISPSDTFLKRRTGAFKKEYYACPAYVTAVRPASSSFHFQLTTAHHYHYRRQRHSPTPTPTTHPHHFTLPWLLATGYHGS